MFKPSNPPSLRQHAQAAVSEKKNPPPTANVDRCRCHALVYDAGGTSDLRILQSSQPSVSQGAGYVPPSNRGRCVASGVANGPRATVSLANVTVVVLRDERARCEHSLKPFWPELQCWYVHGNSEPGGTWLGAHAPLPISLPDERRTTLCSNGNKPINACSSRHVIHACRHHTHLFNQNFLFGTKSHLRVYQLLKTHSRGVRHHTRQSQTP